MPTIHHRIQLDSFDLVVISSSEHMPNSCKGTYRRLAILTVYPDSVPHEISERPKCVIQVIRGWRKLNVGSTGKCAFNRALVEALDEAKGLAAS